MTIFEGVEAKNLLRTSVAETLLRDPAVRIVLFTKSNEKVEYYRKEFPNPRLIFEAVEQKKGSGTDGIFSKLKFTLLRTKTTDLKRRMNYEKEGSTFRYYGGLFLNRLLAHAPIRRCVRFLDYLLVRDDRYKAFFETYKPDIVFLAHLFDEPEIHLVREARRRGVKTVGLINSWDKTTARAMIRLLPDTAITFNEIVKKELIRHDEMKSENIFVSGLPQYDIYWNSKPTARKEFFKKIGIDPEKKLIVYAPMGRAFSGSDFEVIDCLDNLIKSGKCGPDAELFVRFQPNDFFDAKELEKRPNLRYDYPGKRFGGVRGVDWDMDADDIAHLVDTLGNLSVLVSYASSIVIDAAIFGKPSVNIGFELKQAHLADMPTQYYKTDHYGNVLRTGAVPIAKDAEDLAKKIKAFLDNPNLYSSERKQLVLEQCQFTDGKSGERIAQFVLKLI